MTREEEINNACYAYWVNNYANIEFIDKEEKELHTQDIQDSFINGAEWADSTMIEKACEWLHTALYLDHERSIEHRYATLEELLNDFRKAMLSMTQEDKDLLLKDLCARLPYGVKVKGYSGKTDTLTLGNCDLVSMFYKDEDYWYCKPYLRPMSSMTEEEKREIYDWLVENDVDWFDFSKLRLDEILISFDSSWLLINWLNAHHFDYRGLIDRGLAIEVTEEFNPYKD